MNEITIYGRLALAAYYSCYHIACETIENSNLRCLEELSTAAAFTLQYLALLDDLRFFLSSQINP